MPPFPPTQGCYVCSSHTDEKKAFQGVAAAIVNVGGAVRWKLVGQSSVTLGNGDMLLAMRVRKGRGRGARPGGRGGQGRGRGGGGGGGPP